MKKNIDINALPFHSALFAVQSELEDSQGRKCIGIRQTSWDSFDPKAFWRADDPLCPLNTGVNGKHLHATDWQLVFED